MQNSTLWPVLALIPLLFIGLLFTWSRLNRTRLELKKNRKSLESVVEQRTEKLRETNIRLYEAIGEYQHTRQKLSESEAYSISILESMPSLLIGVDTQLNITRWNKAAERFKGYSSQQALGHPLKEIFPDLPCDIDLIRSAINNRQTKSLDLVELQHDGELLCFSLVIFPLTHGDIDGAVIRLDDISRRVRIENMAIQDEKLLSLGRMAAGLAHEINNPLAAIAQAGQSLERRLLHKLPANEKSAAKLGITLDTLHSYCAERELDSLLEAIKEASERAAHTVKSMLEFSHSGGYRHLPFDVEPLLQKSISVARQEFPNAIRQQIEITIEYPDAEPTSTQGDNETPEPMRAIGSANEIQQVIVNLLSNAADSLLNATVEQVHLAPHIVIQLRCQPPSILIDIVDNGEGISGSARDKIFEPFYTTKEVGTGTGLGLAISYFIMTEHHDGSLALLPAPEQGCAFRIGLPMAK